MKTVIEMAEACGIPEFVNNESQAENIMPFAELVRADERELLSARIKELEHQAARYKVLRTWDLGGYDHGLYSPEEIDKAVDDCIKEKNNG